MKRNNSRSTKSTSLAAYRKIPDDEIVRCMDELREKIPTWFASHPERKICKVDLFYGRSIDVRRDNWSARLDKEQAMVLSK